MDTGQWTRKTRRNFTRELWHPRAEFPIQLVGRLPHQLWVCSSGYHLLTAVDGGSVTGSSGATNYREASNELRSWRGWSQLIISCL